MAIPSLEGLSAEDITRLASVSQALLTNPATRGDAQRLVKKIDEGAVFPELDIEDRLAAQRREFKDELDKRDKQESERRAAEQRERSLQALVSKGALTQEDVAIDPEKKLSAIERYMVDNKIADYESAARLYRMEQAPGGVTHEQFLPSSASPTLPTIDLQGKNLTQWSKDEAYRAFAELKSGKLKVNDAGFPIGRTN